MPEFSRPHDNGHAHPGADVDAPSADAEANPVVAEVTRGAAIESRHRAAVAVVDSSGHVVLSAGDIDRPVYARSGIKPIQALVLVESGAAEAFGITDAEIALACASHAGQSRHVEIVREWLGRIGCTEGDLECGPHRPDDAGAARALLATGQPPAPIHNNCSGKHAGFLTVARHLGHPTKGYVGLQHPVMQLVLGILEQMTGLDLGQAPRGIDGCGIPVIAIPLGNVALAMARLAQPDDQPECRQLAASRIRRAVAADPFLAAGTGRFATRVMERTGERALVKVGAEGVYCGALADLGLGIAIKIDDGASRAAEVTMGRLLRGFDILTDSDATAFAEILEPPVLNRAGVVVGRVRASQDCPF